MSRLSSSLGAVSALVLLACAAGAESSPEEQEAALAAQFQTLSRPQLPRLRLAEPPAQPACPPAALEPAAAPAQGPSLLDVRPAKSLPPFADDLDIGPLLQALSRSEEYLAGLPADQRFRLGPRRVSARELRLSAAALARALRASSGPEDLRARLRRGFDVYESVADRGGNDVTVTAYFDAELEASRTPDAEHPFAVYRRPADLVRLDPSLGLPYDYGRPDGRGGFEPHLSRAQVMEGGLSGQGLELAYFRHPADLLILQTEGSGTLVFPDGGRQRVAFDGANGWPYESVGLALIGCGLIPKGSTGLPILAFLKSQPLDKEVEYVNFDPRYTYFTLQSGDGVYGAIGAPLTPERSVAVDPGVIPLGSVGLLETTLPVADDSGNIVGSRPIARLVAAQDTGSAIRGPGRVDYFMGGGAKASAEAHSLLAPGRLYVLVLKTTHPDEETR